MSPHSEHRNEPTDLSAGSDNQFLLERLKPDQTYQAWLVAYLSNGKTVKSNVLDVHTMAGSLPTPERSEVGESLQSWLQRGMKSVSHFSIEEWNWLIISSKRSDVD